MNRQTESFLPGPNRNRESDWRFYQHNYIVSLESQIVRVLRGRFDEGITMVK